MTSSGAIPGLSGFRLVEDHGVVQRYDAVDGSGRPVTLVLLGEQAATDPRLRELFAGHAAQAATAALPGELQVTFDSSVDRPWAASYQQVGSAGAERILPGFVAAVASSWSPQVPQTPPTTQVPPPLPVQPLPAAPPYQQQPGRPVPQPQWDPATGQWVQRTTWGTPAPGQYGDPRSWGAPGQDGPPRRNTALITVLAVVTILIVLGGVLLAVVATGGDDDEGSTTAIPADASDELLPPDLGLDLPPLQPPPKLEGPPPALKDVPPLSIVGPNWGPGEPTQTFAFDGWPFAFRAPVGWTCNLGAYSQVPDAYVFTCLGPDLDPLVRKANIYLRKCRTTCTAGEQGEMNRAWLDEPERAVPAGPNTVYVETPLNDQGVYSVDSSHFFAEAAGQPLKWQIGVYVHSPPDTRDEVLKMLNDIRSQTP